MDVTLSLTPEKKAALERRAADAGTDLIGFILDAVDARLDERDALPAMRPYEEWSRDFRHWIDGHGSRNPHFDDSRDSIYD
jgi:hypothetical protein